MDQLLQIAVQVPMVACVCFVGWKIATLAITKWADGDKERTRILAESFSNIVRLLSDHANEDAENHAALRARIDTALDITPIESGKRRTPPHGTPVAGYYPPHRPKTRDDR